MADIFIFGTSSDKEPGASLKEEALAALAKTEIYHYLKLPGEPGDYRLVNQVSPFFSGILYFSTIIDGFRVMVGKFDEEATHCQVECNIDDMTPEKLASLQQALLEQGASDAWVEAIVMKKNRLGSKLSILCHRDQLLHLQGLVLTHSTTLGLRATAVHRLELYREVRKNDKIFFNPRGEQVTKQEHDEWHREFMRSFS